MAEPTQGSPEQAAEPSTEGSGSLSAEQVSAIVAEAMDQRVSGLMSSFDKRMDTVQRQVREATMTPNELEEEQEQAESDRLAELERENAILRAGAELPAAVKVYQELNAKETGKEQLEFLQQLIDASAAAQSQPASGDEETEEEATAPVDPNPPSALDLTDEAAGGILDSIGDAWPGRDFWKR